MKTTIDPRVQSAELLLTGARLMAGHGEGLVRVPAIARLLGVPLADRGLLLAWIERLDLWVEHPTTGPLIDRPQAGCIDLATLRKALKKCLAWGPAGLPFRTDHLEQNHGA
jgi:hypothetical protein